ncbi:hypothetical protein HZC00_05495 [Candidatus Kaiserbacteria bacterium]|nr:hypothetical protein [Candidatus Kaiserbacteria bacterium]
MRSTLLKVLATSLVSGTLLLSACAPILYAYVSSQSDTDASDGTAFDVSTSSLTPSFTKIITHIAILTDTYTVLTLFIASTIMIVASIARRTRTQINASIRAPPVAILS